MIFYVLGFLLLAPIARSLIGDKNSTIAEDKILIDFASKVYDTECKDFCRTILIIFDEFYSDLTNAFLLKISTNFSENPKNSLNSLFLTVPLFENYSLEQESFSTKEKPDFVFLFLDEYSYNISVVTFTIEVLTIWNIRAKHLFLVSALQDDFDHIPWVEESFQALWERQVLRSVIAFNLKGALKIYTYDPFLENFVIDVSNNAPNEIFMGDIKNMHGYPLKGYYMDVAFSGTLYQEKKNGKKIYRGIDGKFLGTLSDALNATLTVRNITQDIDRETIARSDKTINFMDALKLMRSMYDFDFICNAISTFEDNMMDHVFLERDDFWVVVPKGALVPQYLYLMKLVSPAMMVGILALLGLVTYVMSRIRKFFGEKHSKLRIFENNMRNFVSSSAPTTPKHFQERLLLVFWMYFCLIFDTLFTSYLTSALVKPKFYPDIDKFEDLYETNLELLMSEFMGEKIVYLLEGSPIVKFLTPVSKNVTYFGLDNWYMPFMEQNGVIIASTQINILRHVIQNKKANFHVMSETLVPSVVTYNVVNEKIYYREFLKIIAKIQEAGLHLFWKSYNYDLEIKPEDREEMELFAVDRRDENDVIIHLVHLQAGFATLIIGLIMGTIVFVLEHIGYCIGKKIKK